MPSRSGSLIIGKLVAMLKRDLTTDEMLKCEELALNHYPAPLLTFLDREWRKMKFHTFDGLYCPLANGKIGGARRSSRLHMLAGRLLDVYKEMDLYHPGMTDVELQAVVTLADKYDDASIDRGVVVARSRGINHVKYVLGVCAGNEGKPQPRVKTPMKRFNNEVLRPSKEAVDASWKKAAAKFVEVFSVREAERKATRGIERRS